MKANQGNFESFFRPGFEFSCAAAWPRPLMSALPPRADMCSALEHVRFESKADMCSAKRHVRFTPNSGV